MNTSGHGTDLMKYRNPNPQQGLRDIQTSQQCCFSWDVVKKGFYRGALRVMSPEINSCSGNMLWKTTKEDISNSLL